ncbi:MAG: hypothetical protein IPK12_07330 [Gemmatimonadetes bacterium]|nr:hypothetical protein [Gemmatimonadota bacterium]
MSAPTVPPEFASAFAEAFPNSTKTLVEGPRGVRVPMREIALSGGEPPLRVYDTSGPQGCDVTEGLPSVRGDWIAARAVAALPGSPTYVTAGYIRPLRRASSRRRRRCCGRRSAPRGPSRSSSSRAGARSRRRWSTSRSARG